MNRNLFFILSFFLLVSVSSFSAIHYVKANNPTPVAPYLSWATASDSIQKCINVSLPGDTIYVGNGTYKEVVNLKKNMTILGSGWDSCIVDARNVGVTRVRGVFDVSDSCTIKYFNILGSKQANPMSFEKFAVCGLFDSVNYVEVKNNKIRYCIGVLLPAGVISKNFFDTTTLLAAGLNLRFLGLIKADSNISRCCYYDVFVDQGGVSIQATGNIVQHKRINPILRAAGGAPNNILRNNVIYYNFPYCYDCDDLIISSGTNCIYENNTFIRPSEVGFHVAPGTIIKNNILMRSHYGIELINSGSVDVQYNNFWLVDHRYKDFSIEKDTTNISFNPMFIKDVPVYPFNPQTPGDVHLQRYSPLIDRGDPAILDRDNTRSDIGAYGGPFGEIYEYRDLAPLPPQNLLSIISDSIRSLTLFWSPNTEADLWGYNIYADTISGFVADSTKKIGTTADTTFTVNISNKRKLYLVIKAMDAQGNISQPSAEIAFIRTGIENKPKIIMEQYKLYPNYPNPFNATTKIPYYVSEPSYVNLTITDITGRDHGYLFNGERQPGYYEEIFTAGERGKEYDEEFSLTSGIYFYHIEITNLNTGHLSFMETRKMVYLK